MRQEKEDGIIDDGFSSEEELKCEEINIVRRNTVDVSNLARDDDIRFKIPPPQEIKQKAYSLHPDMATGWSPRGDLPMPIPLFFANRLTDYLVSSFLERKQDKMKLCYLGPRFENTYSSWHEKEFPFPYSHVKPQTIKFTNRQFFGQHWDADDSLHFDCHFESGNLDCAFRVSDREYDCYMRVDSNTRGHLHWFNFKIKNVDKMKKYKINICNLQKGKSLYSRGQKPYIFSKKRYESEKIEWEQMGNAVKFEQKLGKSAKAIEDQDFSFGYKLSFEFQTQYENDELQISYCIPYTYSQLLEHLKILEQKVGRIESARKFLTVTKLCQSLGGIDIPLLIIQEKQESEDKNMENSVYPGQNNKRCVIVSGRVHPGESNGSYMIEGFLNFLCGDSKEAKMLREHFIFKIVPMLNPDGVILGNYRTGISGKDFNREYKNPDSTVFPEVYAFKKLVIENKILFKDNLSIFLDFHGHSTKKNVFAYGPEFPIIHKYYYESRIFPKLLSNLTKMFRYYSCVFKISEFKETTARAIFLKKILIPFSYTIEASIGSYYDHELLKDVPFCSASWLLMGQKVGEALFEYGSLVVETDRIRNEKMETKKFKKDNNKRVRLSSKNKQSLLSESPTFANDLNEFAILSVNPNLEKVHKLFEEIKLAEEEKDKEKNEDDEISEGGSDEEELIDDLSYDQLQLLFQAIKNKKSNISEKLKKKMNSKNDSTIKHFKSNSEQNEDKSSNSYHLEFKPANASEFPEIEEWKGDLMLKPNLNTKNYLLRTKNNQTTYLQSEKKREKVEAKIVNFSFLDNTDLRSVNRSLEEHRKEKSGKRELKESMQLIPLPKANKFYSNKEPKISKKILDLSAFRQTFSNSKNETAGNNLSPTKSIDKKNTTLTNISPRKLGAAKFEEFKYKRMFLDSYRL